jgi:steroid delta-isomerase-like uncharacterized protein
MSDHDFKALRAHREALVLEHVAAENDKDVERVMRTFTRPCYDLAVAGGGLVEGDAAVRLLQARNWTAFTGVRYEPVRLHHADDAVILEYRVRGRHVGNYLGVPPTEAPIDVPAIAVFDFEGRDLVCERPYVNQAMLLAQMKGEGQP